jgi:Protein of unknown function (DUF1264)
MVMRLRLNLMPGFTLTTSLNDLAAFAVRILMSEPRRPTAARARSGDRPEPAPIAPPIATAAPIARDPHCPWSFAAAHPRRDRRGSPRGAHDDQLLDDAVSHRLLYDGPGPDARLIGVEYLVSDEVYRRMPAEEKLYWHDHTCEADAGLPKSPRPSRSEARATRAPVRTLWGKVYYTWASGRDYPRGPSRLSWSDTGELPFVLPAGAVAQLGTR